MEMTNKLKIDVSFGCHDEFECYRCCFKYFDWRSKIYTNICFRLLVLFHLVDVLNRVGLNTFVVLLVRFRNLPENTSISLRQRINFVNGLT